MTARAMCPVCGRTLHVRTDQRLPRHWKADRDFLAGQPRCDGSELNTRNWPDTDTASGPVRHQRT